MLTDNIVKLKTENFPRRYSIISVKNERKLACFVSDEWIIDSTCKSINEMLKEGLISEEAVQGWIELQPNLSH